MARKSASANMSQRRKSAGEPDEDLDFLDDDFEEFSELISEPKTKKSMSESGNLAARRAIELAREQLQLQRELEDYPDF